MNKMKKFEVYTLDTFPDDEDGGWVENERQKIGTIEIQSGEHDRQGRGPGAAALEGAVSEWRD